MDYRKRTFRVNCLNCKWYEVIKGIPRCLIESNLYTNWRGIIYKEHPDWKNYNGACKDYNEGEEQ